MEKISQPAGTGRQTRGSWWRVVLGLTVSLITLAAIFYFADLEQFIHSIRQADYRLVGLAVFSTLAWLVVRALFWQKLLRQRAPLGKVFWTLNEGYLLNNFLPFRLGEVGRGFLLSRKTALSFWEVLSSIIIERILDLMLAVALFLGTLPLVTSARQDYLPVATIGGVVVVGLGLLYLAARYPHRILRFSNYLAEKWSFFNKIIAPAVPSTLDGLGILTDGSQFLSAFFWVSLNWLIGIGQYYLLLRAFIPEARLLWGSFTLAVAALGIAAPSSPGAVGVFEAAVAGSLLLFGVEWSTAVAFAVVTHLLQYSVTGVLGAIGLAHDGESLFSLYRKLRPGQPVNAG